MDRIEVTNDPSWTLKEWKEYIAKWITEYGENSILMTDSGYNNTSLIVLPRKKCGMCNGSGVLPDEFGDGIQYGEPGNCPACFNRKI